MAAKRKSGGIKKKGGGRLLGNPVVVMVLRLLVALFLLFLSRVVFYALNTGYFSDLGFYGLLRVLVAGIRFDLSALLILNAPYIVMNTLPFHFREGRIYRGIATGYFYFINSAALFINFIDTIYFRFTLKRITADIFSYMGVGGDFNKLIPQFLHDFWYVAIIWIVFVAALVWLGTRFPAASGTKSKGNQVGFYLGNTLLFAIFIALTVVGIRGGLQLRPIGLVTAGNYTTAKNIPLLLNTPFSIVKTINREPLKQITAYKSEGELEKVYTPVHPGKKEGFRNLNVMIIILESVSCEHIGILNHALDNGRYQGFTPFLDSLIRQGLYFNAFANGKTSIQGVPAILSAIPSLMNESFIQSGYASGKFTSIAGLLKGKGYESAFFHGGTNGTMGFDSYTKMVGFGHYFGRNEYHNEQDYDGKWGIRDEEFFQYTARTIKGFHQPFVAALFSLSSHHPYYVPMKYANILRKGKLPIQQSVMYTDLSLAKFFHTAQRMPWYRNTLFVITADHTSEGYYPWYQTGAGQYEIPLLFYMPGGDLKGRSQAIAQQTDILPTVLGYLGYDRPFIAFGNDLLDSLSGAPRFSVHYLNGLYALISDGHYLEYDGGKTTSLYDLQKDPMQDMNLAGKSPEQKSLEHFLRAYIQQYNNRLIENRMMLEE